MSWELRLFVSLPRRNIGVENVSRSNAVPDLTYLAQPRTRAVVFQDCADMYIDLDDAAVGVRFRNVNPHGYGGQLEAKVRTHVDERGAEKWSLKKGWTKAGVDELLRSLAPAIAKVATSAPRVLLREHIWEGCIKGVKVEQADLDVFVLGEQRKASFRQNDTRSWIPFGQQYRTICFKGELAAAYALVGEVLGLSEDWSSADLEKTLTQRCSLNTHVASTMIGGYPKFISALVDSISSLSPPPGLQLRARAKPSYSPVCSVFNDFAGSDHRHLDKYVGGPAQVQVSLCS